MKHILSIILLMQCALNAMDAEKKSQPLKQASISIIFKTSNSQDPITKDLTISYAQKGKIVSSSEPLTQTLSSGAYTAQVKIDEQTDTGISGSRYTAEGQKINDTIKASSEILHNGEYSGGSEGNLPVNGTKYSCGQTAYFPGNGRPAEFAKLFIIAKALNNK